LAWQTAVEVADFAAPDARSQQVEASRTTVRVLFDDEAIYIAARMSTSTAPGTVAQGESAVSTSGSDWLIATFEADESGERAMVFGVDDRGTTRSLVVSGDSFSDVEDGGWQVSTRATANAWTAEFRIPHSRLRFDDATGEHALGMSFERRIATEAEGMNPWSPLPSSSVALRL
jgi:hypothetical protein